MDVNLQSKQVTSAKEELVATDEDQVDAVRRETNAVNLGMKVDARSESGRLSIIQQ